MPKLMAPMPALVISTNEAPDTVPDTPWLNGIMETRANLVSRFVGRYQKGEHSHNSSFTSDVTADSALSEGLTAVYRNDPRLGAILSRARPLAGEASFRHETLAYVCMLVTYFFTLIVS